VKDQWVSGTTDSMRLMIAVLLLCVPLFGGDASWSVDFENADLSDWHLPIPSHWEHAEKGGNGFLRLATEGPVGDPRRPVKFALWKPGCVSDFELEVKARRPGKSLLVAFGFQDRLHYYYAHISSDHGNVRVHNGLLKVNGGERYRIGGAGTAPALPTSDWHHIRVVRRVEVGSIEVFVDDEAKPRFSVVAKDYSYGWVGLGSFNETGDFDDFKLSGAASDKCRPERISPLDAQ